MDQQNTIKTTVELDATQAQQEIVKLNNKASDSTKSLQERLDAKNKAVKLQNQLSEQTISKLKKEADAILEAEGGTDKYLKAQKKLNAERVRATKLSESGAKQQAKMAEALKDSKNATKNLDDATGGLLGKFKAFATNPIGLVIIALAGAFKLVSEAIGRSEKASESFGKIGAKLSGLFNGLIAVITPVVELLGEALVFAIEKPGEAWDSFVDTLESGYNFIKGQIIDRFTASFNIFVGTFQKGVLKARIAWNEFTGDSEEAEKLKKQLDEVNQKVAEAAETIRARNQEIADGFNKAVDSVKDFAKSAVEEYDKAAKAAESLVGAERALVRNRIALEKQQLTSLRLAEEQRQIRDDESKSIDERIAANQKLGQILDDQLKRELALAQQNLNFARAQSALTGDTIENIEKIGDAEIKLLEIRERITGQRSEQLVNENALLKEQEELKIAEAERLAEEEEKRKAEEEEKAKKAEEARQLEIENQQRDFEAQLEIDEIELERLRSKGENTLDLELELLERKRAQDVMAEGLRESEILAINEKATFEKQKLRDLEEKAAKAKEQAVLDNAINGAVEAFGIAQEVAVAKMIIAAPEAVAGSFKEAAKAYAPPLSLVMGALGAAGTIAPIIKGLADIKKTRFPRRSKKGGGASSGGSSGSISTSVASGSGGGAGATAAVSSSITPEVVSDLASNNAARLGLDTGLGSSASRTASANVNGSASNNIIFSEGQYSDFQNQVQFREDRSSVS